MLLAAIATHANTTSKPASTLPGLIDFMRLA
jgi:hypothetical protein